MSLKKFRGKAIVEAYYLGLSKLPFDELMKEHSMVVKGYFTRILCQFVLEHPEALNKNIYEINVFNPLVWHIFAYHYDKDLKINLVKPYIEVYFKKDILLGYKKYIVNDECGIVDLAYYILSDAMSVRHTCMSQQSSLY